MTIDQINELLRKHGYEATAPVPRVDGAGRRVFPGHIGTIYQATNAVYRGLTRPSTLRLLPDGTVLSRRAISKLHARERGWRYVVELLERHGAPAPAGDWRAWCSAAIALVTTPMRHHGNHRYVWALDRRLRRHLPAALPYPKRMEAASC